MRKDERLILAVNLYGELKFGNIYVKIEGSIDFLEVQKYTFRSNTKKQGGICNDEMGSTGSQGA